MNFGTLATWQLHLRRKCARSLNFHYGLSRHRAIASPFVYPVVESRLLHAGAFLSLRDWVGKARLTWAKSFLTNSPSSRLGLFCCAPSLSIAVRAQFASVPGRDRCFVNFPSAAFPYLHCILVSARVDQFVA